MNGKPSDIDFAHKRLLANAVKAHEITGLTPSELLAQRDEAVELLARIDSILPHISTEAGVCCCGDDMERHAHPMSCGHSPVDQGSYAVSQWQDAYRAFLSRAEAGQPHSTGAAKS